MTNPLCAYKDLFGKPREGIRRYRIFDIAIYDTVVVLIIGALLAWVIKVNIWIVWLVLFVSGIIAHRLFCVRTGIDRLLFPRGGPQDPDHNRFIFR
jgi:fatty acid desaturase